VDSLYQPDRESLPLAKFVWQHKGKVLLTMIVGLALTLAYLSLATRIYRSEAKLLIRLGREALTIDPTATTGHFVATAEPRESELHAVEELIASRATAEKIVDQFGPEIILEKKTGGTPLSERLAWLNAYNLNPLRVYSRRDKAIKAFGKNLGMTAGKKSNVLSVSYKAEDPQHAHDVLTALVTITRDEHVRVHRTRGSQAFFETQREQLAGNLAEQEQKLREYKDGQGVAALTTQRDAQIALISGLRADLLRARAEQSAVAAEVELRRRQLRDQPAMVVTEQVTGQPQTARQTLRERVYELEVREQDLAARLQDNAPQLVHIRTQIAEARRIMGEEQTSMETKKGINQTHQAAELALQEREAQLVALTARTQSLDTKVAAGSEELKKLNAVELELSRLERELDLARANYKKYSENFEQARIDHEVEAAKISSLNLMQAPTLSVTPVSPQPIPTLALGLSGSLIASLGVALLFHRAPVPRSARTRARRAPAVAPEISSPPLRSRHGEPAAVKPR
jgi:polysaccharide biosynthesis protein PslE